MSAATILAFAAGQASAQPLDPSVNAYSVTGPDASPYAITRKDGGFAGDPAYGGGRTAGYYGAGQGATSGGSATGGYPSYGSDVSRSYSDPYAAASAHGAAPGVGYVDPSRRSPSDPYYYSYDPGWRRRRLGPGHRATNAALSVGSSLMNAVFTPVKVAVGLAGAEIGGVAGAMNGGDREAAAGIWNVTTDGSYFVTPRILDGREPFYWGSDDD